METKYEKVISRRRMFYGKKYWLSTNSIKSTYDGKWSNCLYLHFAKEDFPEIKSPPLVDSNWGSYKKRFKYDDSILNSLEFHGGITFYEEVYSHEAERTLVKVGCDYQHLWDDEYRLNDNGESLLDYDGQKIVIGFENLLAKARGEGV